MGNFSEVMDTINANNSEGTGDEEIVDQDVDTGEEELESDQPDEGVDDTTGFDPSSITDPMLLEQYQRMQASFTPRLQEAAELRRQYEGVDPVVLDAVRQYQTLLQSNPYEAREYLAQQQAWLDQQLQLQHPQDPFQGVEPITDGEKVLLDTVKYLWEQQQQQNVHYQQMEFSRRQEAVVRKFAELESEHQTKIPLADRNAALQLCQQTGCTDVSTAWKALNYDKALQKGVQKGAAVVKKKQTALAPPTNRQQRGTPPSTAKGRGIESHFEEVWKKYGG